MSDEYKPTVSERETEVQPRKGGKVKRHCLRFWWAYLIAFVCIVILVVCLIIFVGVPKIAQNKVNDATLEIDSIVASNTQSDNFTMSINSTIRLSSSTSATIDAFEGVMYLEDYLPHEPFLSLAFPQTTGDSFQVVNISQFTPITDMEGMTRFNTWLLLNDSIRVTVEGDTNIHVKGLSRAYPINFKKTVTLKGLQNFNGTTLPYSNVSLTADENGDNFHAITTVPNRSVVTFELGNVSFTSYLLGQEVGTTYMDNMVLRPGLNNFTTHANISQSAVLNALQMKPYCDQGGLLPFQLTGKDVVNNGQHLPYYAHALGAANQTIDIPIGFDLKRDHGIALNCKA
ncbi:hypothetical protein CONLIGDRAFT_66848 [Coniochaeta ligniaria NRRL 30616]|uniref:Uncharacterized protein n=1 Tax=Coniochaeta ligniaria NRRL 30616 TaxID=1408157 RepID=A0A1J7J869_9PEZI|nr:hypothetical protein CONLIGDRAFT_66848 [Coniochaeta ligniaria NRRL 30616]